MTTKNNSRQSGNAFTERDRIRRVALLCCHFLRNLAYYRAGWRVWVERAHGSGSEHRTLRRHDQFWITANGNFLDACILEWCKLFADPKGKHHWRKVVPEPELFTSGLLTCLRMTQAGFDDYIAEMKRLRDKFLAHLDEEHTMEIPRLRIGSRSVAYLYNHLVSAPETACYLGDAKLTAGHFYAIHAREGRYVYSQE